MTPYEFWKFITDEPFGPTITTLRKQRKTSVNWFLPPISKNSGGHINMFRFICGLEARGFDCRVVITHDGVLTPIEKSTSQIKAEINQWYGSFNGEVYYCGEGVPESHFSVATGWQSAYPVKNFRGSPFKCYLVQDYEPYFYAASSETTFAEETYKFGFTGFTAGDWLADLLASKYGMKTHSLGFSYDRTLYYPRPRRDPNRLHLFCYVRPETPRRGWEITLLTLAEIHKRRPDINFILAGGGINVNDLPFPAFAPGALSLEELPDLYSQCDAALVISLTNLSLLPLELMACGTPVITNSGPNVEWLLGENNSIICDHTPSALAKGVLDFFELPAEQRVIMSRNCVQYASSTDWNNEVEKMANGLKAMLRASDKVNSDVDTKSAFKGLGTILNRFRFNSNPKGNLVS